MKKNLIPILLGLGVVYYMYSKKGASKMPEKLTALDPSAIDKFERDAAVENKPKTLLAKGAALFKKAAQTKEGKALIKKGVNALTRKKQLKKLGAEYLYL
jgi:hypothetical protein